MRKLLEEVVSTLEHAQVFISSRQKMHKAGMELYQETIDRAKRELDTLNNIESIRKQFEEELNTHSDDNVKCGDNDNSALVNAIERLKQTQ